MTAIDTSSTPWQKWLTRISDTTKTVLIGYVRHNLSSKNKNVDSIQVVKITLINGNDTLRTQANADGEFLIQCNPGIYKAMFRSLYQYETNIELKGGLLADVQLTFIPDDKRKQTFFISYTPYSNVDFDRLFVR